MSEIRVETSLPADVPALKRLWKQAFGDDDACIDLFFDTAYRPEQVFVLKEDGAVQAMAYWWPMTVCEGRRGWNAAYLYAVATEESARGRGFCGRVLDFAREFLAGRGVKVLLLVPVNESLRKFYERYGYHDCSAVELTESETVPVRGEVEWIEPPEYLELREQLLADRAYVSCPVPVLDFQARIARLYGGGLMRLRSGALEGCACVALDGEGRAVIYELLWPGDRLEGASLAAARVGASQMLVRTPGDAQPFAMAKWLIEPPAISAPYLGIALD